MPRSVRVAKHGLFFTENLPLALVQARSVQGIKGCTLLFAVSVLVGFSCNTYKTNDETLEKSACLRQDAKGWRMEIAKYRYNLDIVKVKLEMYPGDTDRIPEILVPISFSFLVMLCVIGTVIYRCI